MGRTTLRVGLAVSVTILLLLALAFFLMESPGQSTVQAQGSVYHTLRVYGEEHYGAGYARYRDPITGRFLEDPPYTYAEAIFNPELEQAPRKDSVTFNPLWMSEFETLDENHARGLYNRLFAGSRNATEKVWFRMWYEPWHWDKDLNANGELDINETVGEPITGTLGDEWYPAIMQEFTYLLMEAKLASQVPEPLAGPVGSTSFVFPVGMRKADLFNASGAVDTTSANARFGYGLTSLDGDFDGTPDIVHVESEQTLYAKTRIAADFNGNGFLDPLDVDGDDLSGDELVVFRLESKREPRGGMIQFLDHMIVVKEVFNNQVQIEMWYTGDLIPMYLGSRTIAEGDMLLAGSSGPGQHIRAVANGGTGTNLCDFPTGPFFVYLEDVDNVESSARVMVGRALGATHTMMEASPNRANVRPGEPWFLKRFYVDGHEYNVVAIKTEGSGTRVFGQACTLDVNGDKVIDPAFPTPTDGSLFKFITIRTPIPKAGVYDDPLTGHLIEQHSVRLQPYAANTPLSVMPPYNYEHYILLDVQAITGYSSKTTDVTWLGTVEGPVPPILQSNGPIPYQGVGPNQPYANSREMHLFYVEEAKNPQFLGELKELYYEEYPTPEAEYWYAQQFHTLPWEYTEFVLPDINPANLRGKVDRYLLNSAFVNPYNEYVMWEQTVPTNTTPLMNVSWNLTGTALVRDYPSGSMDLENMRVKFWFDPAVGGKKYKDDAGIRLYGLEDLGPGADVDDPLVPSFPVEVKPYTDPMDVFNPIHDQAPPMDSLTFNPAYMDKFLHSNEALTGLYRQISIRELDAREKVFLRMWYEPEYLDKIRTLRPSAVYTFPAVMQEFTYMYLNTADQPASAQPGSSAFAFPMATAAGQLPSPDPLTRSLPAAQLPSFGYGLTTFDANFDGQNDIVHLHSERSLAKITGIQADFDGDGIADYLDQDGTRLSGDEMVVFTVGDVYLQRGKSVQFLDHMITLDNVSATSADLIFWYTGGGLHPVTGGYSLHPDRIDTRPVRERQMAIANRSTVKVISAGGNNLGSVDGAWFVYVNAIDSSRETVSLVVGRALGAAHSAIDNGQGGHDLTPGDPWYLKRFFVDGHEYNVVAVHVVRPGVGPNDEPYEFKYITIRTPVPKLQPFVNYEDSQVLEAYYRGIKMGVDTSVISVMPPFNVPHTGMNDIQALQEKDPVTGAFIFDNPLFYDRDCRGDVLKNLPALEIRIVDEAREPQFWGELRELYTDGIDPHYERWMTEQFHTVPDQYTELRLPPGQKYLLTSAWESYQSRSATYRCPGGTLVQASVQAAAQENGRFHRVQFWYDPIDRKDVYVNTWQGGSPVPTPTPTVSPTPPPGGVGTILGKVTLQGRSNHGGVQVHVGGVSATSNHLGQFVLNSVPVGTYEVLATAAGYLDARMQVVMTANAVQNLPDVQLRGGDANNDCTVNVFDLVVVAWNYGSSPPTDPRADINGNNTVDIFDLVLVAVNLDQACPGPWTSPLPSITAQSVAMLELSPAQQQVAVEDVLTVTVSLADVVGLYGADIGLTFDPTVLEVVDADPVKPGVQITAGDFLNTTSPHGILAANEADNEVGTISYAASLTSPTEPAEGSGALCIINFRAKAAGHSMLRIASALLLNQEVEPIGVTVSNGWVHVGAEWISVLPLIIK